MPTVKGGDGREYPASAFLYVPDASKPSTWNIRYKEYEGGALKVTKKILGAAAAAIGPGFRGQKAQLPPSVRETIRKKLISLYRSLGVDRKLIPSHLIKEQAELDPVTIEERCEITDYFTESLASGKVTIDVERGIIKNAPMIGLVSKNTGRKGKQRRYAEAGLMEAFEKGKYEGIPAYLNHQDKNSGPIVENLIGTWKNTYWDKDSHLGRGDLQIRDKASIREEVLSLAKDCPSLAGPSHRADGAARFIEYGGKEWDEIYYIDKVQSVDLVAGPATVHNFMEASGASKDNMEVLPMAKDISDNTLTIDELKAERPDLVRLIKEEENSDNRGFEELYKTIRTENEALKTQLKEMKTAKADIEGLYQYKETLKTKLTESVLPKASQDRIFNLFSGAAMLEEKIVELIEMETKYLEEVTGKKLSKARVDAPADNTTPEESTGILTEAFRKKLGYGENKKDK